MESLNFLQTSFSILRKRKDFGCVHIFSDRNSIDVKDGSVDCPGYEDENYELNKVELDKAIQVIWRTLLLSCGFLLVMMEV